MDIDHIFHMSNEKGWSKELLYQLVDNVKDYAIFVSDADGQIVSWNIGAEKIFGYSTDEVIGQNCRLLFTPEDRINLVPEKEKQTALEEGCAEDERWHLRKDGTLFFASGVQTPLYDETGKHTGFAKIARDLTERITFQSELNEIKNNLEVQVSERTDLSKSNDYLRSEVLERTRSEETRTAFLRNIVKSTEDERKRIAREIHDHIGQQITGLRLNLQVISEQYKNDSELTRQIEGLQSIAIQIDSDVDFLIWELRPSVLDDFGLALAMEKFVKDWSKQFNIPAEFNVIGLNGNKLLPEIEINLYRIGQEALNNICKYAKAKNAEVSLERQDDRIILIIEDDGIGFESSEKAILTGNDRGMGLLGMKERAELIGGTIEIESSFGKGTTIYVRVPAQFEKISEKT